MKSKLRKFECDVIGHIKKSGKRLMKLKSGHAGREKETVGKTDYLFNKKHANEISIKSTSIWSSCSMFSSLNDNDVYWRQYK